MTTPVQQAILFADISGSTRLYETLGDVAAKKIVGRVFSVLTDAIQRNDGTVVKTIGDEVMCRFESAEHAARASMEMQRSLKNSVASGEIDARAFGIRVGFHFGPVILENDDLFGDAVNIAARVTSKAKPREILTTKDTVDQIPPELRSMTRFVDQVIVKGKQEELKLFEVVWEHDGVTVADDANKDRLKQFRSLRLRIWDTEFVLTQAHPSVQLGRGKENDIVIEDTRVSRMHTRIEFRRDKFVLIDQSINGTYVLVFGEREVLVRRDELQLRGSGIIALGHSVETGSEESIHFVCESEE